MNKVELLGTLAVLSLTGILFSPIGTDYWRYPLVVGLIFGFAWFWKS